MTLTRLRKLGGTADLRLLTLKSEVPARLSSSFAPTNTFIFFPGRDLIIGLILFEVLLFDVRIFSLSISYLLSSMLCYKF